MKRIFAAHAFKHALPLAFLLSTAFIQLPLQARPIKRHDKVSHRQVKVFLVALGDNGKIGKKFGCEDSLVPVKRTIKPTRSPLKAAIQQLLAIAPDYPENPQLKNFWKGRNLQLKSVSLRKGVATIVFSGEIFVAGICDEPRIIEQIEATARQFASVKKVKVLVNGHALAEVIR
jgi:spore germination protein GerM